MKPRMASGEDGLQALMADLNSDTELTVMVCYLEPLCPVCELRPGTLPGVCHLVPTPTEPSSVFVYHLVCGHCYERLESLEGDDKLSEAQRLVTFFDRWLELEWAPQARRGQA